MNVPIYMPICFENHCDGELVEIRKHDLVHRLQLRGSVVAYVQFHEVEDQYAQYLAHSESRANNHFASVPRLQLHTMQGAATSNLTSRFALKPEHTNDEEAMEQALIERVNSVFELLDSNSDGLVLKRYESTTSVH